MKFKILNSKFKIYILNLKFLLIAGCFWLVATPAKAQEVSLGIWPPLLEVMIQPGKGVTQVYKVINQSETDLVLTSKIVPFTPEDELGTPKLNLESQVDYLDWFSFQNADLKLGEKFLLPKGKEQQLVLKIKIPPQAPEGDYYLTLLLETVQIPGMYFPSQSGGQIEAKIGGNILLTVSQTGKPKIQAKIEEFKLKNFQFSLFGIRFIDSFSQPQFLVRLRNTGQAFFKPQGTINVNGWFGQKWELTLLPENVLINSTRQINCQGLPLKLEEAIKDESQSYSPTPCQLSNKFFLGKYQAKLEFNLGEEKEKYQAYLAFWALPIKLIIGIIITLFFLIIFFQRIFPRCQYKSTP